MKIFRSLVPMLCALGFAVFTTALNTYAATDTPPKATPAVGELAPDFAFTDFEGNTRRLSDFRGKPVLLDFWATWCSPCIAELPTLRDTHTELKDKGLVVLSISLDNTAAIAKTYVAKNKMPWNHGWASGVWKSDAAQKFKISEIPSLWFIGADGKIKAYDLRGTETKPAARALLENKLKFTPPKTVKVSGLVVDDENKPIAGAKVIIDASTVNVCADPDRFLRDWTFYTDEKGIWTCEKMPPDRKQIHIGTYHRDYLFSKKAKTLHTVGGVMEICDLTSDFYTGKHKIVLQNGIRVSGVVKNANGIPQKGVSVANTGTSRYGINHEMYSVKTDDKGEFYHTVPPNNKVDITIQPESFAPETKTVEVEKTHQSIEFTLQPAHTIKGIVVDTNGKPISKVWFSIQEWRGKKNLRYHSYTDAHGRFELKNMPEDSVTFRFEHNNFTDYELPLKTGEEHKIVMMGETKIKGKVVDAETEEQIKKYKLDVGDIWVKNDGTYSLNSESRISDSSLRRKKFSITPEGIFNIVAKDRRMATVFRVFVDGYIPETSEVIKPDGKSHEIVIKLSKGKGTLFKIVDSNGNIVENAQVLQGFLDESRHYSRVSYLNGENRRNYSRADILPCNADGTFSVPPTKGKYRLTIAHPAGWAEVYSENLSADKPIILSPWQTIRGKAFVGNKPDIGTRVHYRHDGYYLQIEADAVVDENGNFEIKHAVPGLAFVGSGEKYYQNQKRIQVIAGKNNEVDLGPVGRPVKGKLILPASPGEKEKFFFVIVERVNVDDKYLYFSHLSARLGWDENGKDDSGEDTTTREEIAASEAIGSERMEKIQRRYMRNKDFAKDGSFLIKNMLPGKYALNIHSPFNAGRTFEVKLDTGKTVMEEPQDIGVFTFEEEVKNPAKKTSSWTMIASEFEKKRASFVVGSEVPDFPFVDLDGKVHHLSDYKGKTVLVYCWLVYGPQNRSQLSVIQAIEEKHKADSGFVVLRLSFSKPEALRRFVAAKKVTGFQGILPREGQEIWSDSGFFISTDTACLIGPDGKILAKDLKGDAIEKAVAGK